MKKRHILFILVSIIITSMCIAPCFFQRVFYESNHRGYVTAIEINNTYKEFVTNSDLRKFSEFTKVLSSYKESGVTTAVIREEKNAFNINKIKMAKDADLDIALAVYGGRKKSEKYLKNLENIVKDYDVKYILLKQYYYDKYPLDIADIVDKYKLIVVACETSTQLGNEIFMGYRESLYSSDGRMMRSYETYRKPSVTVTGKADSSELLYNQMINSARDRNTEFMFVNQITDQTEDPYENAKYTQKAIKRFGKWMDNMGYTKGKEPNLKGYYKEPLKASAAVSFIGAMMALVMINILFKKSFVYLDWAVFGLGLLLFAVTFVMPQKLINYYPTLFSLISSCFGYTMCLAFANKLKGKLKTLPYILSVFGVAILSLGFGAFCLCASLGGIEYYMNTRFFYGVKLTLLAPVAYAVFATTVYMFDIKKLLDISYIKEKAVSYFKNIKPLHVIALLIVALAGGIYILRSGNATISVTENNIRNLMSEITGARPRTKEFLIGWPALALFAYYVKNDYGKLPKWIFSVAASVIFASVINTFCHVFTDVSTSALRTLYGLILSVPFTIIFILVIRFVLNLLYKKEAEY